MSVDGITWALKSQPVVDNWYSTAYGNGIFVAVASSSKSKTIRFNDGSNPANLPANTRTITTVNTLTAPAKPVPGTNRTSVNVTGLTGFTATDNMSAWVMADPTADATSDHNAFEHLLAPIRLRCTNPITGTGFTIQATSEYRLDGAFTVRYAWAT